MKLQILSTLFASALLLCTACGTAQAQGLTASSEAASEEQEMVSQADPAQAELVSTIEESITLESEHPPLSDATKEAITAYKRNPCEETAQVLYDALNDAYDQVIATKWENLGIHTEAREDRINAWMHTVMNGEQPPFVSLEMEDDKGGEREAASEAVEAYFENPTIQNRELVRQALNAYYDAFLTEQEAHAQETQDLKEERIAAMFERFISDSFQPQLISGEQPDLEDILAEIMCSYISAGAEFLPVNPEARVRERSFNAEIASAQEIYLEDPTPENLNALEAEVTEAFRTACEVREEGCAQAEENGRAGAEDLLEQMLNPDFLAEQYEELTQQLNLYGRIDRIITFGCNTYGDWTPRMEEESKALAKLLIIYQADPTAEHLQAVEESFYALYDDVLRMQAEHLEMTESVLENYIADTVSELIS